MAWKKEKMTARTLGDEYHKKDISHVILIVTKRNPARSVFFVHRVREAISKFKLKCS